MINFVSIKPIGFEEADLLFKLRNQNDIVRLSASQKTVTYEEHLKWLQESLLNISKFMFLILVDGNASGFISFQKEALYKYIVSLYLVENFRGMGVGRKSYFDALNQLPIETKSIVAKVRKDNFESQVFFSKLGFVEKEEKEELVIMEKMYD